MASPGVFRRSYVTIGTAVALNIAFLILVLKRWHEFRPPPIISQEHASAPGNGASGALPTLEHWRLDTNKDYVLDMTWDLNAAPTTRRYDLVITEGKGWPDGVVRNMLFINGKFPGPLIEVNRGDRVVVNVTNGFSSRPTAMHWHGIRQRGTNWYDGTVGVTQCGIPPGKSLVYDFVVDGQFGTYWYHSHYGTQNLDGAFGPLVVHAPEEAPTRETYDQDRVVMLQDWYHSPSEQNLVKYLAPGNENNEPIPDNGLINGRNSFNCSQYGATANRTCHGNASRSIFLLEANKRSRLRLINTGAFAQFEFSVDKHMLDIIEADGTLTQPHSVHRVPIHVGERYSVVLATDQSTSASYWMRAKMVTGCFSGDENPVLDSTAKAVISYAVDNNAVSDLDSSSDWKSDPEMVTCQDLEDRALIPLVEDPPPPATRLIVVDFHFGIGDYQLARAKVNETTWTPQQNSTTLMDAVNRLRHDDSTGASSRPFMVSSNGSVQGLFEPDQLVIDVSNNGTVEVVDLLVWSLDEGAHPFHLHGHDFWVLQTGGGEFDWARYHGEVMPSSAGYLAASLRRDTLTIRSFSWALIRFVADNPGLWAFHCHMGWHMEAGLLMQFMSRADILRKTQIPEDVTSLCVDSR